MYTVYLDESGVAYNSYAAFQKRKGAALLVLGAVGIRECQLPVVDDWFNTVKASFLGSRKGGSPEAYEIKGSILYSLREGKIPRQWEHQRRGRSYTAAQKAIWNSLKASQLEALERSVFDLVRRLRPTIWLIAVKQDRIYKKHKDRTWHPFYWALTYLQQRVSHYVEAQHGAYERAIFVMDENSNLKKSADFDAFLKVRETINSTAPWPVDFTAYLMNIPVFGKSHLHQALQLADIVVHAAWKKITRHDSLDWFAKVEPMLARHWSSGDIQNAGLTFIE